MTTIKRIAAIFQLVVLLGCSRGPDVNKVGVFCDDTEGIHALTTYAEDNGMGVIKITGADVVDSVPRLSAVSKFFVNIPGARIADTKVYWPLGYGERGTDFSGKPYQILNIASASALPISIELVKGNMYRVMCEPLKDKTTGLAALVLDGRYYVIDTGKSSRAAGPAKAPPSIPPSTGPTALSPTLSQNSLGLVSLGTYSATARDMSSSYEVELWKDARSGEVVGWITHGSGCNDPIGRLENVRNVESELSFTARLYKEDITFSGQLQQNALDGVMGSTWAGEDDQGKPYAAGTWHIRLNRNDKQNDHDYDSRAQWEESMKGFLSCCGPSVEEITPCQ